MKRDLFLLSAFVFAFVTMACTSNSGTPNDLRPMTHNDSIVKVALGDSIFDIIKSAKPITAEIIGYTDSTKEKTPEVKLSQDKADIMKFLLSNPDNVASNDTVYGLFLPNAVFTFKHKKKLLRLYFDYGLKKWQINDANDKPLMMFDIRSNEFLRLVQTLFPDDEYFNKLIKKLGL